MIIIPNLIDFNIFNRLRNDDFIRFKINYSHNGYRRKSMANFNFLFFFGVSLCNFI